MHMKKTFRSIALLALVLCLTTAAFAQGEKPYDGTLLNYITWRTDDQAVLEYLHQKFYEETGIKVNVEWNSGGDEHRALVAARMQADECDLFAIDDGAIVQPFIENDNLYAIPADTAWIANYDKGAIDAGTFNGQIYSLPQCTSTMIFYYDKAYFDELGIAQPETWEDFTSACQTILEAGERAPLVMGAGEGWLCANLYYLLYATIDPATSATFLNDLENGITKLTSPSHMAVAEHIAELFTKGYFLDGTTGTDPNIAPNLVLNGVAAMSMEGSWRLYAYDDENFDLGIFIPKVNENAYCVWPNQQNVISASSKHIDECMLYLEFMSQPENAGYYCNQTVQVPTIPAVVMENEYIKMLQEYIATKMPVQSPKMNAKDSAIYTYLWDFSKGLIAGEDPQNYAEKIQANIDATL